MVLSKKRHVCHAAVRFRQEKIVVQLAPGRTTIEFHIDQGPRIPVISDFVAGELSRLAPENQPQPHTKDAATLDALLVNMLIETYGREIGRQAGSPGLPAG